MNITDRGIKSLKPKADRYEVWEDNRTGFGVRVSPAGRKSWVFMYRYDGKARRMTLGTYPAVGLASARVEHAKAGKVLEEGSDPGKQLVERRKADRSAETVADLVGEYLEKWARPRKRSAGEDERILGKDVLPVWGRRKARDIGRRDVVLLLDGIIERGAPIQANRTLSVIRRMFNFAISRGMLDATPVVMVKAPSKENQRDRVLTSDELRTLWHGLANARMSEPVRLALKFMVTTAQRKGEIVNAEWDEFDFEEGTWTIPASRSKNQRTHRVPLSTMAVSLLGEVRELSGGSPWLFPSPRRGGGPISAPTVNHALLRSLSMIGVEGVVPHDLRRSAASAMTSLGVPRLVVSKLLNHIDRGVTAIYDRHGYDREKRQALDAWGAHLEEIVSAKPTPENVIKLQRG
jgi:integrase